MTQAHIKNILLATDFSEFSEKAKAHAVWLATELDAKLHVVHVFDTNAIQIPAPYYFLVGVEKWLDENIAIARKRCGEMLKELSDELGDRCATHLVEGKPGHEIVGLSESLSADLIVMGTHGYTGLDRMIMGSVAEYIMRHATCPVMTIRVEEKD